MWVVYLTTCFPPRKMCTKIFVKWGGLNPENKPFFQQIFIEDKTDLILVTTIYECFVSYCNLPRCNVESPLEHVNSSLLCMLFEFSFDTVRSTNDSLKQITGMLLICSSCLWFNQLFVPELVQHEQRPQHVQL